MLPNTRCVARSNGRSSRTPRDGSHGHFHVPGYIASVRSGKVNATTELKVERLAPGVVKVDDFNGFAPLALEVGREPLVDLAREQGIAALAITNTHHFAALWPETEALPERAAPLRRLQGGVRRPHDRAPRGGARRRLFSFEASEVDPGDGGPPRGGELVLAIDPKQCSTGGNPVRHAEALFARIREQEGARLPSDRRYAARQRTPTRGHHHTAAPTRSSARSVRPSRSTKCSARTITGVSASSNGDIRVRIASRSRTASAPVCIHGNLDGTDGFPVNSYKDRIPVDR